MLWPDEKRVRYAAIRQRMADGSEGRRMRRIKGARHAHGRDPGIGLDSRSRGTGGNPGKPSGSKAGL